MTGPLYLHSEGYEEQLELPLPDTEEGIQPEETYGQYILRILKLANET